MFKKISSIEDTVAFLLQNNIPLDIFKYQAKPYLYGIPCRITIQANKEIKVKSNNEIVNKENDKKGVYKWLKENEDELFRKNATDNPITIYGVWAGKDIKDNKNNRLAISKLEKRYFFPYLVISENLIISEPNRIGNIISYHEEIKILPYLTKPFSILEGVELNEKFKKLFKKQDIYINEVFGVEGEGEGIISYPINKFTSLLHYSYYSQLIYKS